MAAAEGGPVAGVGRVAETGARQPTRLQPRRDSACELPFSVNHLDIAHHGDMVNNPVPKDPLPHDGPRAQLGPARENRRAQRWAREEPIDACSRASHGFSQLRLYQQVQSTDWYPTAGM